MELYISYDAHWESGIIECLDELYEKGLEVYFENKNYSKVIDCISVAFRCQSSNLGLREKIRYSKKDKTIYIDFIISNEEFKVINKDKKILFLLNNIYDKVPSIISSRKLAFDSVSYKNELKAWVNGNYPNIASRFE